MDVAQSAALGLKGDLGVVLLRSYTRSLWKLIQTAKQKAASVRSVAAVEALQQLHDLFGRNWPKRRIFIVASSFFAVLVARWGVVHGTCVDDMRYTLSAVVQAFASLLGLTFTSMAFRLGRIEQVLSEGEGRIRDLLEQEGVQTQSDSMYALWCLVRSEEFISSHPELVNSTPLAVFKSQYSRRVEVIQSSGPAVILCGTTTMVALAYLATCTYLAGMPFAGMVLGVVIGGSFWALFEVTGLGVSVLRR